MKVTIIGPGYPLRGGISKSNHRLAKAFVDMGHECEIVSFSLQYPSFLFPGKTQFSTDNQEDTLKVRSLINSINPFNWCKIGRKIKKEKPDLVVVRYWLPFMGASLGTILRQIRKNKHTKIVCLCDNAIPHESRIGDKQLTQYFAKSCHGFVAMSEKVLDDLNLFAPNKPKSLVYHPIYDNFGAAVDSLSARKKLNLPPDEDLFLFFGFIRKYKGLDILIDALAQYKKTATRPFKLVVSGEFYEDEKKYLEQIKRLDLEQDIILYNQFIPDSEVKHHLSACDLLIQPYRNATQSGVTPLAYHFEIPMIVTKVGGLEQQVPDGKAGFVVAPNADEIANAMHAFVQRGKHDFIAFLHSEKQNYSWEKLAQTAIDI
ncbi:MAG TPA: glycosyltransferase [Crocinitomicaceae bacterium]|nr:glycosyltransferase [Crocinitomicaceae bacterium]